MKHKNRFGRASLALCLSMSMAVPAGAQEDKPAAPENEAPPADAPAPDAPKPDAPAPDAPPPNAPEPDAPKPDAPAPDAPPPPSPPADTPPRQTPTPPPALKKPVPEAPARLPKPPVQLRPKTAAPKPNAGTPKRQSPAAAPAPGDEEQEAPPAFESGVEFKPVSPRTKVTFNLEDADLPDLVRLISNLTGRRFILPGKTRTIKATVFAPTKVTAAEAYNAFLSILEVNGLTVVPAGRYLKIVETGGIANKPLPTYDGTSPGSDRYVTRLHRLENVSAEDVTALLGRFKSRDGDIVAYAPTNMLIVTDTGAQIKRMLRLIRAIDVARTGTQIWIEPIHYAAATEIAERLQEIFPSTGGAKTGSTPSTPARPRPRSGSTPAASPQPTTIGGGSDSTIQNILADERTNSLIIIATERAYLRILEMVRHLDIPLEGEGRVHVHYVQHGAAQDIAAALSSLIGGTGAATPARRTAGRQQQAAAPTTAAGQLFEGEIRVTAYEPSNALVITASLSDYAAIKRVIERLDAPRRQVFIEAVVMELSITRSSDLGLSYHGGIGDFPSDGSLSVLGFNAAGSLNPINQDALTGLALGIRGPTIDNSQQLVGVSIPGFGVAVNALATSGDVNVLSTPHIIAMDNVEAEISVGENIPLQQNGIPAGAITGFGGLGTQPTDAAGLAALGGLTGQQGIQRQDVGTTIRITPHINENDEVRLEIEEEISERGSTDGTLGVVSINRRTARTEMMAGDQQTIVIGGLMRDSVSTSETKVPVLGDIPLLGALFRRQEKSKQKTNLILFLTPYIIRDPSDLRAVFERKMRERQEFLDRFFVFGDSDYEPPIDYNRTRGLVAEIVNEITAIEEELALAEALKAKPPPDHVPRPPIGTFRPKPDVVINPDGTTEELPSKDDGEPDGDKTPDEAKENDASGDAPSEDADTAAAADTAADTAAAAPGSAAREAR